MLEKRALPDQILIKCLTTNYGIAVATPTFLPIGTDTNASIYKAQAFDQTSYFIKLKLGHHHDIGVEIAELLQRAGIPQTIPPIKTIHGKSTQPIDDFTLIVYPFVEGQDGFRRSLTDDQWIKLGKALKLVHEVEVPSSIQNSNGKTEINPTSLAYYRHERIVEDIAIYSQELLLTTAGGKNRLEMYKTLHSYV